MGVKEGYIWGLKVLRYDKGVKGDTRVWVLSGLIK